MADAFKDLEGARHHVDNVVFPKIRAHLGTMMAAGKCAPNKSKDPRPFVMVMLDDKASEQGYAALDTDLKLPTGQCYIQVAKVFGVDNGSDGQPVEFCLDLHRVILSQDMAAKMMANGYPGAMYNLGGVDPTNIMAPQPWCGACYDHAEHRRRWFNYCPDAGLMSKFPAAFWGDCLDQGYRTFWVPSPVFGHLWRDSLWRAICRDVPEAVRIEWVEELSPYLKEPETTPADKMVMARPELEPGPAEAEAGEALPEEHPAAECCICLDNPNTHATIPCGHKAYCEDCVELIGNTCAICKGPITGAIKIFNA